MSRKRVAPVLPRRPWYGPDKLRAAFYAGQGMSASRIAHLIGGTTAPRVRSMLRAHDIPLMHERSGEDILFVRWKLADREALDRAADKRNRDPAELAALIIRRVLERPKLLDELVHDLDVV